MEIQPALVSDCFCGFHHKYQIVTIPSFVVIDKAGQVAAFIEGPDYQALKQILSRVMR